MLIYPKFGFSGSLVSHMPLGPLYASIDAIKAGFEIDFLDVRLNPDSWRERLSSMIGADTLLVGISVWTGAPILSALEISRWLKQKHPGVPVVWGGPHAAFDATDILSEPSVEYAISGYGSVPLAELAKTLSGAEGALPLGEIPGLVYRGADGVPREVAKSPEFERTDYRDIPYDLLARDLDRYGQLGRARRIFSLYSAMGCPYQCSFCSSPAQYRPMKKKYIPYTAADVVDHIQHAKEKYGAEYIYFIDDDSFVKLDHVEAIIDEINRRGIKIGLGFRGARISEIKRMSDEFLTKLARAGTDIMHIGAESGSQKILNLIRKNCTVQDIIDVNRKMARHPEISAAYNWIVGLPGETLEDLRATQQLMLQVVEDNPRAILFIPNKFRPLPGTELYELALRHGYKRPQNLEEWAQHGRARLHAGGEAADAHRQLVGARRGVSLP
ncbi:MAG: B12-binding domain-containing radical SAM protein [Deltaproteobacteria bacterium]|nr:B12-binding domain-containing radical SAM protein [Deltaproteobacteria bacterium]